MITYIYLFTDPLAAVPSSIQYPAFILTSFIILFSGDCSCMCGAWADSLLRNAAYVLNGFGFGYVSFIVRTYDIDTKHLSSMLVLFESS
jgi:hypothetical protein